MEATVDVGLQDTQESGQFQKQPRVRPDYDFEVELRFTETYQRYRDAPPAVREAKCLRAQFPSILGPIEAGDLFAGRLEPALVGFTPDEWGLAAFGYYSLPDKIEDALWQSSLPPSRRRTVEHMREFWRTESTAAKVRAAYTDEMKKWLPSDKWMEEPGIAFPLYRLTGGTVNYGRLLRLGIPGLVGEIKNGRSRVDGARKSMYDGMLEAVEILIDVCEHYEAEARSRAPFASGRERSDLLAMADTLAEIVVHPPRSFREAIQLFWLYSIVGDLRNHGRMDVYLGDYLARDRQSGSLEEEEALRLLQSLWRLMAARNTRVHNRVIIGGVGRSNETRADQFALLAMEATRTVLEAEPQLSLRFYDGMNPALMATALDVIAEGRTFPMLYNDDVNVPAVMNAFGFDRRTAEQYVPYGCGEYVIEGRSFGTPSGVINLLKALEVTIHNGLDPLSGRQIGLALGSLSDFTSFDALWDAYTRQVEHFVDLMARQERTEYDVAGQEAAFLYLSMLYDDCLLRGDPIFAGGIRYLGGTFETYGNTNTADSLTAIKELVYERNVLKPGELLAALDRDFIGFERLRRLLEKAPKYGNDDPEADEMLLRVHDHVCSYVRSRGHEVGLDSYLVVVINNSANTLMGRHTSASADGRGACMPMNNGNNPSSGSDRHGATAFLNSLVKPDPSIHAGAVQNITFSRDMFTNHRPALEALLDTYFASGGTQAMINVLGRKDLENAVSEPQNYRHVFVRVGGFSARFVDLPHDVQLEILQRTLY